MDLGNDFDRLLFFEHARKTCEANYIKNPLDAEVLLYFIFSFFVISFLVCLFEILLWTEFSLVCAEFNEMGGRIAWVVAISESRRV